MRRRQLLYAVSILAFPVMLLAGFALHPDLTSFAIVRNGATLARNFHHQVGFHLGHLVVALAVAPIIASLVGIADQLRGRGAACGFWGAVVGVSGAVILALDKGALCLVLSAFDALPEPEFQLLVPSLQVIVDRRGLLWITWLLPLLPLGAIVQALGLLRERQVSRPQGIAMIAGLALLVNPDLELISVAGAVLMIAGYAPLGLRLLAEPTVKKPVAT